MCVCVWIWQRWKWIVLLTTFIFIEFSFSIHLFYFWKNNIHTLWKIVRAIRIHAWHRERSSNKSSCGRIQSQCPEFKSNNLLFFNGLRDLPFNQVFLQRNNSICLKQIRLMTVLVYASTKPPVYCIISLPIIGTQYASVGAHWNKWLFHSFATQLKSIFLRFLICPHTGCTGKSVCLLGLWEALPSWEALRLPCVLQSWCKMVSFQAGCSLTHG